MKNGYIENRDARKIQFFQELTDGTSLLGWKSESPLTPIAPSYAYYFTHKKIFSRKECKEWNDYLLEQEQILLEKYKNAPVKSDGGTGLGHASITSCFPYFNVLKFDFHLVEKLKTEIFDGIKTILFVSDNTTWHETLYAKGWFNVLRKGEGMNIHPHGYSRNSFYGFHLTINAIETVTTYYHPIKYQLDTLHMENKIGYLTLFPSYIPHGVSSNNYETPRISIAGDVNASTWLDQKIQPSFQNKNYVKIGTYNGNNELQETK